MKETQLASVPVSAKPSFFVRCDLAASLADIFLPSPSQEPQIRLMCSRRSLKIPGFALNVSRCVPRKPGKKRRRVPVSYEGGMIK